MTALVPIERIASKIYLIREVKVMLDSDLAELYDVETKILKRAVRRNIDRFSNDFMFELSKRDGGLEVPIWHLQWRKNTMNNFKSYLKP
jgi:hypothetical protein